MFITFDSALGEISFNSENIISMSAGHECTNIKMIDGSIRTVFGSVWENTEKLNDFIRDKEGKH